MGDIRRTARGAIGRTGQGCRGGHAEIREAIRVPARLIGKRTQWAAGADIGEARAQKLIPCVGRLILVVNVTVHSDHKNVPTVVNRRCVRTGAVQE